MKKIIILCMSCKDEFFINQEKFVEETWGKDILNNKYPNISLYFYRGGYETNTIYKDNRMLFHVEDDIYNTFKKSYCAFSICESKFKYDYIFRTNTSTFVNVELLNKFVQSLEDDEIVWSSDLISLSNGFTPKPLNIYGRGNGILLSRKNIQKILTYGLSFLYSNKVDDEVFGNILNTYNIISGRNYLDYIKSYKHCWFKCINDPENKVNNRNNLCNWNNENCDWNFMKHFITIQIKRYWEREIENNNYTELYNKCFKINKYNDTEFKDIINEQYSYSNNPNIFIGSILGYVTLEEWKKMDMKKLYDFQVHNKSADDPSRGKNLDLIIL